MGGRGTGKHSFFLEVGRGKGYMLTGLYSRLDLNQAVSQLEFYLDEWSKSRLEYQWDI